MNPGIYNLSAKLAYFPGDRCRPYTWARIGNSYPPLGHLHFPWGAPTFLSTSQPASPIHVQLSTPSLRTMADYDRRNYGSRGGGGGGGRKRRYRGEQHIRASFTRYVLTDLFRRGRL